MSFEHNNESPMPGIEQAMAEIQAIRQEVASMGANDSEFEALKTIAKQLQEGTLTPEEAILQARQVRDSKQDYH